MNGCAPSGRIVVARSGIHPHRMMPAASPWGTVDAARPPGMPVASGPRVGEAKGNDMKAMKITAAVAAIAAVGGLVARRRRHGAHGRT